MKSDTRIKLKIEFPYEMHPNQFFYYKNFKFKLVEEEVYVPAQFTQVIEGFGTQILDDITPQYIQSTFVNAPTTQIVSTQEFTGTMVLDSQQEINEMMDQFLDIGIEDKFTQTENDYEPSQILQKIERSDTKYVSLFSSAMNFQKSNKDENSRSNEEHQEQVVNNHVPATVIGTVAGTVLGTVVGTVVGTAQGTVFGSQGVRNIPEIQQQQQQQQQQIIKQPSIQIKSSTNYESNFQQSPQFNLQFGDLFGSGSNNDQQSLKPPFQRKYLKQPSFMTKGSEESEKVQESPTKKQENNAEPQSAGKEIKNYKFEDKNQIKLKKITDQGEDRKGKTKTQKKQTKLKRQKSSSESEIESSEEEQKQKKQLKQQSSIELPPGKDFQQRVEKSLKENKQLRPRKKLRKISQQVEVYKIQFSGYEDEIPSKEDLEAIGLELIEDPTNKYDILILGQVKRTFKLLQALMMGAYIVSSQWIKDSLNENEIKSFSDYIPDSDEFTKQFQVNLNYVIENRDRYFKSNSNQLEIFKGTYYVDKDVKPSKIKIEELIKLGGGKIIQKNIGKNTICVHDSRQNCIKSELILDQCMFI